MLKRTTSWGLSLGVTSSILMTSVFASVGGGSLTPVVHAAEKTLSQDEAIKQAQKWVTIPEDYKLEEAMLIDQKEDYILMGKAFWNLSWETTKGGRIILRLDAVSGQLLRYDFLEGSKEGSSKTELLEQQAIEVATQFLDKVTTDEERSRLSKPNEFRTPETTDYFNGQERNIRFTRVENGIPFLHNGYLLTVGSNGDVIRFRREWFDGKLPDASKVMNSAEAAKKWEEEASPSLLYKNLGWITNKYQQDLPSNQLVYSFQDEDPQLVEATTGKILNKYGMAASEKKIKPLGTSLSKKSSEKKLITADEAQKVAEQYMKRFTDNYRSDGISSRGRKEGLNGVTINNWRFDFAVQQGEGNNDNKLVRLRMNDRGDLLQYAVKYESSLNEASKKMMITWKQAEESAIKLVQTLLADQLGEIYLIEEEPSEETLKSYWEMGQMYEVQFGILRDGIPIENAGILVDVNLETGEAETMNKYIEWEDEKVYEKIAKFIDVQVAKKTVQENNKLQLTYYLSLPEMKSDKQPEPLLVYHYIGDEGVVKADSGEWYNFREAQKKPEPRDSDAK
ncbi:YcdB/YcdC domain-containing protein [Brevibacillus sp. FIR094]|uniref:YcdB/YcdC domain-containing protein n=1 Tax=Brevibacillus sp. FIR094 TaxID=3134809 RepID=UPI003D19D742